MPWLGAESRVTVKKKVVSNPRTPISPSYWLGSLPNIQDEQRQRLHDAYSAFPSPHVDSSGWLAEKNHPRYQTTRTPNSCRIKMGPVEKLRSSRVFHMGPGSKHRTGHAAAAAAAAGFACLQKILIVPRHMQNCNRLIGSSIPANISGNTREINLDKEFASGCRLRKCSAADKESR
ncbi:hypothetical protein CCHR01_00427 [Colletotrichum chrysophilum]|uniref:Uncharacterized protein n=1 Tax=Colletotrichum chrysophilum TaxID=1836956 RepID=A0AAD9B0W1_9PEZI|nr:hypothetical protein CCHR01_00427 [Colletotrichum chrysophilum]